MKLGRLQVEAMQTVGEKTEFAQSNELYGFETMPMGRTNARATPDVGNPLRCTELFILLKRCNHSRGRLETIQNA